MDSMHLQLLLRLPQLVNDVAARAQSAVMAEKAALMVSLYGVQVSHPLLSPVRPSTLVAGLADPILCWRALSAGRRCCS